MKSTFDKITREEIQNIIGDLFIADFWVEPDSDDGSTVKDSTLEVETFDSENDYIIWKKTGSGRPVGYSITEDRYIQFKRKNKIEKLIDK